MSGPLPNPRHERFAQELAKGKVADDAAEVAGLKSRTGYCGRLAASVEVVRRIAELQSVGAAKAEVTIASLIDEADGIKRQAMEAEHPNFGAAVSALTLKARLAGFLHDKPVAATGDTYNIAFIKAPPQETFEQFNERRTRQLRLVKPNGNGRDVETIRNN